MRMRAIVKFAESLVRLTKLFWKAAYHQAHTHITRLKVEVKSKMKYSRILYMIICSMVS